MSSDDRRARARRRAWGRGPAVLRFEPLEGRQLLSGFDPLSALSAVASSLSSSTATTSIATAAKAANSTPLVGSTAATTPGSSLSVSASGTSTSGTAATTADSIASSASTTTITPYDGSNLVESSFNTPNNLDWGDTFHATGTLSNLGSTATQLPYDVNIYASTTSDVDANSVLLGTVTVPAGIDSGASSNFDQVLTAPRVPLANLGGAPSYCDHPRALGRRGERALDPRRSGRPAAGFGRHRHAEGPAGPRRRGPLRRARQRRLGRHDHRHRQRRERLAGGRPADQRADRPHPGGQDPRRLVRLPDRPGADPAVGALQTVTATQKITLPSYAPTRSPPVRPTPSP